MFREFNVEFENVEMINGADNLLEGTEVTKVIMKGDNQMSSLNSFLKNCDELDTIQGGLSLGGVSDIGNILEGNNLIKSIYLKDINNQNISANNSFPNIEEITIGGELYNKKALQNVIASKEWTFDNINYVDAVGENVITKEVNIVDDNKIIMQDTLEQKAKGMEIIGQTYENLIEGSGEVTLLDELTLESVDGNKEFTTHIEQEVCVETIEGETYQNLVKGNGEYKLTDSFSTTWTESNNSIENPPSVIEITEMWGNTIQDETDLSNIQSVGDLYVDENGKAILDEDGNEQYKLEIISSDGNGKSNKTTILMPQPLRRITSTHSANKIDKIDKLYWDSSKGKYILEQNIKMYNTGIPKDAGWGYVDINFPSDMPNSHGNYNSYPFILEGFKNVGWNSRNNVQNDYAVSRYSSDNYVLVLPSTLTMEEKISLLSNKNVYYWVNEPQYIETKILEKPSLETYSPKTYISTNSEVQPSQMAIANKQTILSPLSLQTNTDYTLQLDSVGKNNKNITVNLGGTETTIQPTNDTKKHHKVVVRTPATLTNDTLELSGEGVIVNDVMLFEGGSGVIKQDVGYIDGIESIGEVQICKNLFPNTPFIQGKFLHNDGSLADLSDTSSTIDFVECNLDADKHYSISCNYNYIKLVFYDNNKKFISYKSSSTDKFIKGFNVPANVKYYRICCSTTNISDINLQIEEGNDITEYQEYFEGKQYKIDILSTNSSNKNSKTSILLPQPLNKIGDIKDKFYWDDDKGHYCIEQNFGYTQFDGTESWGNNGTNYNLKITGKMKNSSCKIMTSCDLKFFSLNNDYIYLPSSAFGEGLNQTSKLKKYLSDNKPYLYYQLEFSNIIDLPNLNKKYSLDTYIPTTHIGCIDTPLQPSKMTLKSDIVKYKPIFLDKNKEYQVKFDCKQKGNSIKLKLGGAEKTITPTLGENIVSITTPQEIVDSRLYLIGANNKLSDVYVIADNMSTGELQDDGTYKIDISTTNQTDYYDISIIANKPLGTGEKLYWNNSNKRYEIDRNGEIEVPMVEGDIIDLPRLYQKEDTTLVVESGNIKPSNIKIEYLDID